MQHFMDMFTPLFVLSDIMLFFCRLSKLPEDSDREHHHCQYYHQHSGLPSQTAGTTHTLKHQQVHTHTH